MKITEFQIHLNKNEILRSLDCYEDSSLYEELSDEYDEWIAKVHASIEACALIAVGIIPDREETDKALVGKQAIYVLLTIGDKISSLCSAQFQNGDYLTGMLIDAMADQYLFQMEHEIEPYIRNYCEEQKLGISKRLESPVDLPMEFQRVVFDMTNAKAEGVGINDSFMLCPLKSMTYVYLMTEDRKQFQVGHDCRNCNIEDCKLKKARGRRISVYHNNEKTEIICYPKESVMEGMQREKIPMPFPCGGRGSCGKCKIRLLKGQLEITERDRAIFTDQELERGYRLACRAYPDRDCEVSIEFESENGHEVLAEFAIDEAAKKKAPTDARLHKREDNHYKPVYGIGIDIGTTTLAMQLVDVRNERILATYSAVNGQRSFGADVISRIEAQMHGKGPKLQESIRQDLQKGINELSGDFSIERIVIAGNTTMIHLLLGLPCKTLGEYPFTPVNIERITGNGELVGMDSLRAEVVIYPGISTFVGGDIVAGLMACEFYKRSSISMLIDLGTNGEMAIGNASGILCTSTAAGPAFEGGNICCGVGSIPGAICGLELAEHRKIRTIGDKPPIGICGTGIVEAVAELLEAEIIDETGLLSEEYFDGGYPLYENADSGENIVITQKDIREFQLAKSAVRSGVELLIRRYRTTYEAIDKVYLAGGFGYAMNIEKAVSIGLFPEQLKNKLVPVGNAALNGTLKELFGECDGEKEKSCIASASELSLSSDKEFNDLYMEYMYFE